MIFAGSRRKHLWAVALAVSVTPYGDVATQLAKENPWRAFRAEDPILTAVRAERVSGTDCARLTTALVEDRREIFPIEIAPENAQTQNWGTWVPFDAKELDAIQGCDDFPCAEKLDRAEVDQMKAVSKENRPAKFLSLVLERMRAYLAIWGPATV